jgi:acyl-phosphate glycerol 3-phosphate acyltransferase
MPRYLGMNEPVIACLTILGAYLIGAIPFGYLVARWRGVDIFKAGSGNIGATNIGRVLGRRFGILVFLLDFAKGALPVLAATALTKRLDLDVPADALPVGAGLAAFLGHLFPVYIRFRGGKGVATGAGVVAMLLPVPTLGAILVWVAVLCATRTVSLASLSAAVALCALRLWLTAEVGPFAAPQRILTSFCLLAVGLVFLRHHANIARLLHGNENHLRESPVMLLLTKTIHVLAVGLWFGTVVFFSFVVALVIFHTFQSPETAPARERAAWVPLLKQDEMANERTGTRLAGAAVGPIFPWYFVVQGICGMLALATASAWTRAEPRRTVHRLRFLILTLALATVLAGWPVAQKVAELRVERYDADTAVRASADAAFMTWHTYSLVLNLVTVVLVTVVMALAAQLPFAVGEQNWFVEKRLPDQPDAPARDGPSLA